MADVGDFNYLDFFKEEIRSDNLSIRINAVSNMYLVASALGPQKAVNELLPYIKQVVNDEPWCNDEEFLFNMAKQYAMLPQYINTNSSTNNLEMLIAPLEHLAA